MIFDKQRSNWADENLQWIARFGKNCRGHADELDGKRDMLVWWRLPLSAEVGVAAAEKVW